MSQHQDMIATVLPGDYVIGSSLIPHAGPEHRRRVTDKFWIDAIPLSWADYEIFVAAAGYRREEFWIEAIEAGRMELLESSVDFRIRQLLEGVVDFCDTVRLSSEQQRLTPLTGINWFEACAICRFFEARLPFEIEWEAAMQSSDLELGRSYRDHWAAFPTSAAGCKNLVGKIQEWTADAFHQQYWVADFAQRGRKWDSAKDQNGVCVRGASPRDLYQHISYRTGRLPEESDWFRGFRRVWDAEPPAETVATRWRVPTG